MGKAPDGFGFGPAIEVGGSLVPSDDAKREIHRPRGVTRLIQEPKGFSMFFDGRARVRGSGASHEANRSPQLVSENLAAIGHSAVIPIAPHQPVFRLPERLAAGD